MKITLTSVHFYSRMSQETNCFDAVVCIDGKPAFHARNEGMGGPNFYESIKGMTPTECRANIKRVEDHAKTLPKIKAFGMELDVCIDTLVDDALTAHLTSKQLTNILRKKTAFTKKGQKGVFTLAGLPTMWRMKLNQNASIDQILNDLPFEKALELFLEHTKRD
jgi:hypothetical protein